MTFENGVEKIDHRVVDFCDNLKEVHIPETVYSIEDMELESGCSIYGLTGTEAERFAHSYGYPFVSQGKAAIGVPDLKVTAYSCNNMKPEIKSECLNADFYEYVLSKDKNFPKTGKYLYYQERSRYLSTDFYRLDKGTYYVFARAGRYDIDSTRKYSAWTKPVKMTVAVQAPGIPKIKSITVKGTTVTVTLNRLSGADGCAAVLAAGADKVGIQKVYQPYRILYSSGNKAATQFVFKNVKPGSYRLMTRGYKQGTSGKFYGKWGRYGKKITVL